MSGTTRPRLRLAAAVAAAAALVLTGCSSSGSSGSGDAQTGFIVGKGGAPDTAAAGHRKDAPDISGTTLEGAKVALSDYRGKVVVLNIWGSWCNPCRAEAPNLQSVWNTYKDQGVQFLGINTRDIDPANAVRFEQEKGVTFPSLYDPDGTQILKFPKGSLNPQSIPTTLVIDRDGKLAARAMRALEAEDIEAMLKPVLAEQKS
ncbi:TlpA family protein disulfide reductase [Kitasatospora sp. NBC_00240]|uniref:TlpA family protein disulfide reductase n=1 Tax=Kitasatospora sp. NBC_00240 TaxID=2903567 RepID=UPI00225A3264|nr:TlpA disulfide reductase family protein [Kitasatospora sp. NBC_00240]MCX5212253.1 TlpA family protein disulfide reductase [Kitasatospora sp. NBC_00240]